MYMRLQGYPPDKITILTTYNGQKHLIRDVLNKRCARNQAFGLPEKVKVAAKLDMTPPTNYYCIRIIHYSHVIYYYCRNHR